MHEQARSQRLIAIANELLVMARNASVREGGADRMALAGAPADASANALVPSNQDDHPFWTELAHEQYRSRRRRDKIFGTDTLFGEPAWDILLDLFIAAKEERRVSVMSACIGAAVPSTTALRWITALEREGLLLREDDPVDARRTFVQLTKRGYGSMVEYFASAARPGRAGSFIRDDNVDRSGNPDDAAQLRIPDDFPTEPAQRQINRI